MRANVVTLVDVWKVTCGEVDFAEPSPAVMKKPL
jgi:hypothetical protein